MDIVDKLLDLHKQATTERSHYYVASLCREAIHEIDSLRKAATRAADIIDKHLLTQREKVTDASAILRKALPK